MVKHLFGLGVVGLLAVIAACNSSSSGDCSTLQSCCSQLTDASNKSECTQLVTLNDATSCGEAQSDFENQQLCTVVTSSSGGSSTGCAGLTTCCASVPEADQSVCAAIAGSGDDNSCTTLLESYESTKACTVSVTVSSGGTGCSGLSACCAELSSDEQGECTTIVGTGVDSTCTTLLESYQTDKLCSGGSTIVTSGTGTSGGTGCSGLSSCCDSLEEAEQAGCNAIVTEGSDATCTEELTAYQDDGMCGGSTTTSGTGTSGGTGCSGLSSCCDSLPEADQASCNEIASDGDDATCSEELTAYMDDSLCN